MKMPALVLLLGSGVLLSIAPATAEKPGVFCDIRLILPVETLQGPAMERRERIVITFDDKRTVGWFTSAFLISPEFPATANFAHRMHMELTLDRVVTKYGATLVPERLTVPYYSSTKLTHQVRTSEGTTYSMYTEDRDRGSCQWMR